MTNPPKNRATALTRDEILSSALQIVDEQGLGALTMRKVAQDVGVEAMSLYHHVPNKDALLDGLLECVLREMHVPDPLPADWKELMEEMVVEFRRVLVEHPNVLPLAATRPPATSAAAPYMRVPLQLLSRAGLPAEDVVALYQSLLAFTFGHSILSGQPMVASGDAAGDLGAMLAEWDETTFRRGIRALIDSYSPPLG